MTIPYKILCVIGTRPEAIKMAPVIQILNQTDWARCIVLATAQHREMLDQVIKCLNIKIDHDLDLMAQSQNLTDLTCRAVSGIGKILEKVGVDTVLAQGDTTSVFASALSAFYSHIPFGHIEAGLRTRDLDQPYPEEGFRQMISRIARWNFVPTPMAAKNLAAEGINDASIYLTGNTGIDALLQTVSRLPPLNPQGGIIQKTLLVTAHRRENFGAPMRNIFEAIRIIVDRYPHIDAICPIHPNPNVKKAAMGFLTNHPRIKLTSPQDYFQFVDLMRRSYLILSDSGGIQEEAPALKKPVLVLRNTTERPESVEAGVSKVIGTECEDIVREVSRLIEHSDVYNAMAVGASPYGDGNAAHRIVDILYRFYASNLARNSRNAC